MSKAVAYYDSIYLVATDEERASSHRVTEREGPKRPGEVKFSGVFPMGTSDETYGTLVLDEEKWKEWFGRRQKLEGMMTAKEAAETLVSQHAHIYYGCPLCIFRSSDAEEAKAHIHEHINKFVQQFRIEMEVENDTTE